MHVVKCDKIKRVCKFDIKTLFNIYLFSVCARYSFMLQWVIGSILHGGPIELFLVPASASRLKAVIYVILSVGWCIQRSLAANQKRAAHVVAAAGFLFGYLCGPLCPTPYNHA